MVENDSIRFSATPLFQLNLILWLVWPIPLESEDGYKPIFREDGYVLQAIAPSLTVPLSSLTRAREKNVSINASVSPEALLKNSPKQVLLPIECKMSSFSPNSTTCAQANALLSLSGADIARNFPLRPEDGWQSYVTYVVQNGDQDAMHSTLQDLGNVLRNAAIEVEDYGAFGIEITADGVYLQAASGSEIPVTAFSNSPDGRIQVMQLKDGDDPRSLYLIPFDPSIDANDLYGKRVIEERIRIALITAIGSNLDQPEFDIEEDSIMNDALEIWSLWKDSGARSNLMRGVRQYIDQILREIRRFGIETERKQGVLSFSNISPSNALEIRRYLLSTAFRRGEINPWQEYFQLGFKDIPNASSDWE